MSAEKFHKTESVRKSIRMADIHLSNSNLDACIDSLNLSLKTVKELKGGKNEQKVRNRTRKEENSDASQ